MKLTKHKYFEFEYILDHMSDVVFNFSIDWRRKCDHAGITLLVQFFDCKIETSIYDNRHWNGISDRYYLPLEELIETWIDGNISKENFIKYYGFDPSDLNENNCTELWKKHFNNEDKYYK